MPRPKEAKPAVVERLDKRKLAERMVDIAGMTQAEADAAIQGFSLALGTWIESMVRNIPRGSRAECTLQGIGRIVVTYKRKGKYSSARDRLGIPQQPAHMHLILEPTQEVKSAIGRENKEIIRLTRPAIKEAIARVRAAYLQRCADRDAAAAAEIDASKEAALPESPATTPANSGALPEATPAEIAFDPQQPGARLQYIPRQQQADSNITPIAG